MTQPRVDLGTDNDNLRAGLWTEIEIHQALNRHWTCRIVLRNTPDARPDVEAQIGKPLRVSTHSLLGVENVVFAGVITRARLIYEVSGAFGAEVEASSHTSKLEQGPRWTYFKQQTAQAAVTAVLGRQTLALSGQMPAGPQLCYVQHEETDLAFVARLVDDVEAWFRPSVDPGSTGVEVQTSFQSGPTVQWREGEYGLLEWETHGNVRPMSISGTGYDPQPMLSQRYGPVCSAVSFTGSARMVNAASAAGSAQPAATMVERERTATNGQFEARLGRESRRASASSVLCRGISREPQVRAGDTVTVVGLPEVDSTYGVIECTHRWNPKGYENSFVAVPASQWSPAERAQAPAAPGVYAARVVENFDPHNQGRIQVAYFWQETGQTGWVRLLSPHAGADRGLHFVPEKGDEVLIGFEEGDPERPYMLGSVWNGVHPTPAEGFWKPGEVNKSESAPNEIKRLVTRSGHRITLIDTPGRETITLATPTGARIVLAEQLNETEGRPGILLHSDGDIVFGASGRIHEQSQLHTREVGVAAFQITLIPGLFAKDKNDKKSLVEGKHRPCAGIGMDNNDTRKVFAERMKALRRDWPNLKPEERLSRLGEAVNVATSGPALDVRSSPDLGAASGTFSSREWRIKINDNELSRSKLGADDDATLAATTYHEARHSQQAYLAARMMAADGASAADIQRNTGLPSEIAAAAVKDPIKPGDPASACAAQMKSTLFGTDTAANNTIETAANSDTAALNELIKKRQANVDSVSPRELQDAIDKRDKSIAAYRHLAFEADAFETANPVKRKL